MVQDLSQLVKLEERNPCVLDCSFGAFKSPVLVTVSKGRDIHAPTGGPVAKILNLCCVSHQRALCRRPHPVGWVEAPPAAIATASLETESRSSCPRGRPHRLPPPLPRRMPSLFSCLSGMGWEGKTPKSRFSRVGKMVA